MFLSCLDDRVPGLLDAQVHDPVPVVAQDDVHQVLADVVHIALHGSQHDRAFLRAGLLLHPGFKISDRLLHHACRIKHRGELHLASAKQVANGFHAIKQHSVDQIERRVLLQRIFQQIFQALLLCPFPHRLFAIDNGKLQLVLNGKRLHMRGSSRRRLAFHPGEMIHVLL